MYNKTKHVYSLTNNEQETQTDGQDTQWARFIDFEKGKYLFKIREGGDSHMSKFEEFEKTYNPV